jgi:hypothetical protein
MVTRYNEFISTSASNVPRLERRGELGCTQESRRGASTIPDQSCAMLYTSVIACANRGAVV